MGIFNVLAGQPNPGTGRFVPSTITVDILMVAAGGGSRTGGTGSGGGGGGVVSRTAVQLKSTFVATGQPEKYLDIVVGLGVAGGNGQDSTIKGTIGGVANTLLVAYGGGVGGMSASIPGNSGGSGGGGAGTAVAGSGIQPSSVTGGFGNAGFTGANFISGGGGGGAGFASTGANGGDGLAFSITGTSTYYAGGGGGGRPPAQGGGPTVAALGGGGTGTGTTYGDNATAGVDGLGGGAGGQDGVQTQPLKGGDGVVIIAYKNATQLLSGGTVTSYVSAGTNWVHSFRSSGTLTKL